MFQNKTVKAILTVGAFVAAFAIARIIVHVLWPSSEVSDKHGDIVQALTIAAGDLNEQTPMTIDADTRLDTVFATPDRKMNYKYTLVNYTASELDWSVFETEMKPALINSYCTHSDLKWFRNNGVPMRWHYFGSEGAFIGAMEATPSDCAR